MNVLHSLVYILGNIQLHPQRSLFENVFWHDRILLI